MASNARHATQRGAALMVMLVILVLGGAAVVLGASSAGSKQSRQERTARALAQAKEALIGYAVTYGDTHAGKTHGYLPCPDMNGDAGGNPEGSSETCGTAEANTLGRLPWKTLGIPMLLDGAGECLWYAVSGNYKNNPPSASAMNWDNAGRLEMLSSDGSEIAAGEILALVIAPGGISPTAVQNRSGVHAPACGGNYSAAEYLDNDTAHGVNNANIAQGRFILPHEHRDAGGRLAVAVNDQFAAITRQDVWSAVQKRIAREAQKCLDDYAAGSGGKYPWAAPVGAPTAFLPLLMGQYPTRFGRFPARPGALMVPTPDAILDMQAKFAGLWSALATFAASKTSANLTALKDWASAARDAADAVGNDYQDASLHDPAADMKHAATDARDVLSISSSAAHIQSVQERIAGAASDFTGAMSAAFPQAPGMENTWPASCGLFSSVHWEHWKDLIFFHVAEGYGPGGAGSCDGGCLHVEGSAHTRSGSGSYRAAVIAAGKRRGANRDAASVEDYLDADNLLPRHDANQAYQTHRITDAGYRIADDLVLCLDGGVNCP